MDEPKQYILDDEGRPIPEPDLLRWAQWLKTADCGLADDELIDPDGATVRVSTIFLGLDQRFRSGSGPPVLWETVIFGGAHGQGQWRYASAEDARRGHAAALALVRGEGLETER